MPTVLTERATDRGTFVVDGAFADEDGNAVIPNSIAWTLTVGGTVINGRADVPVTPAAAIAIVLSGDDLAYADGRYRFLTLAATYDSTLGVNLPLRDQVLIYVDDLEQMP